MQRLHFIRFTIFVLFFVLAMSITPALAQDAPAATPVVTVEATPAPVVATQPPVTVNVEAPVTPSAPTAEWWQIALVLFFGGSLVIDVITLAAKRESPQVIDSAVVNRLQSLQDNREAMDRVERAYQSANRQVQIAFDTLAQTVRFIAPMTPGIRADDKLADVLADIAQPGAPTTTAPVAVPPVFTTPSDSPQG